MWLCVCFISTLWPECVHALVDVCMSILLPRLKHACRATKGHTCLQVTMQRGGVDMGSEVNIHPCPDGCAPSDQDLRPHGGGWDMYMRPTQWFTCYIQLYEMSEENLGSLVVIVTCTDACTPSNQGVETDEEWLGQKHWATQRHTQLCGTMQKEWGST